MSWLVNSHIENVRIMLNNMLVVDPSRIEMQDLKEPGPGKLLRLKRSAYGSDVRSIVQQLQVGDVTQGHAGDLGLVMRLADSMSAVNDNLRGLQDTGGRKTATEVRTSSESGTSRLAATTKLVSAHAMVDLAQQLSLNTQQYLSDEFLYYIAGAKGAASGVSIKPEMLVGDFNFPVHDGTLPLDKVAMLDVWKEILFGVAGDPDLRGRFDIMKIFEHVAMLGGAKNIDSFKLNAGVQSEEQIAQGVGRGDLIPVQDAGQLPTKLQSGSTPGVASAPASRAAGGM